MTTAVARPEPKPAPTQARARARRHTILEAANSFVLSGEIENITTTAVAHRARVPVGSVYRYFDGRIDILDQLYRAAYDDIESSMADAQKSIPANTPVADTIYSLLNIFVKAARSHPNFRTLTKWANKHYSLWDVTPGDGSNLASLVEKTLMDGGVVFPNERQTAATKTIVTVVSILVDQSLEEEDEGKAQALINELGYLLNQYIR